MRKTFVMIAVGATTACATMAHQALRDPVVTFKDLRLEGVGLKGGTLDVILGIYNPNGFRLDASHLTYRLLVDTTTVGQGIYDEHFSVQNGDSTIVILPVSLDYAGLSAAGQQLLGKGSVDYHIIGDVTVATPLGSFTRPYSQTGRFTTFGGASH